MCSQHFALVHFIATERILDNQIINYFQKYINILIEMNKYSSDSESQSEKYYKKSHSRRSRERSYSSDSSTSKTKRRKDKKYRRDRSKSRGSDKYTTSRRDRSSSRHRTKSYYTSKSSRYSHSPERSKKRSPSRDRYRSKHKRSKSRERSSKRSRSNSRTRYRKSRKSVSVSRDRKEKSPSTSTSSSTSIEIKNVKSKQTNLEKAMKAAEIAKKKLKISEPIKEEITSIVLDEINDDSFAPKPFVSKSKKSDHIVIDLKAQTIKMPDVEITEPDSIFHPNLFQNEEARTEKWVKELFTYRQKAINGELLIV